MDGRIGSTTAYYYTLRLYQSTNLEKFQGSIYRLVTRLLTEMYSVPRASTRGRLTSDSRRDVFYAWIFLLCNNKLLCVLQTSLPSSYGLHRRPFNPVFRRIHLLGVGSSGSGTPRAPAAADFLLLRRRRVRGERRSVLAFILVVTII